MKKTIFLSVFLLNLIAATAQVQFVESNASLYESVRKSLNSATNYNFIGYNNSDFYLLLGRQTLCKINSDVTQAETFPLSEKLLGEVLFNFNSDSGMGLITFVENNNSLVFNRLTVLTDEDDFSSEQLISLGIERGDSYKFIVCENSEKTVKSVLITLISKYNEYQCSYILTFDVAGDLLWQTKIVPQFEKTNFTFDDIAVSNESNTVFIIGKSYNLRNGLTSNTVLEIVQVDPDGISDQISEQCPFAEIRSMKCKILNNNNLFVAGFYKEGNNETDGGTFSALYNENLHDFSFKTKTFKESLARGVKPSTVFKSDFTKQIVGIYELSDTSIVVVGEDRQTKIQSNALANNVASPSYMFNAGNIFVGFYTPDGNLKNISVIYKNQIGEKVDVRYLPQIKSDEMLGNLRHLPVSVSAIKSGKKLFLVFNDNVQNPVHQNIANREDFKQWEMKINGSTVLCTIEGNSIARRKTLLINAKEKNIIFHDVIYSNDHKALFLMQLFKGKYDYTFGKLTY